ncbi:MAG: indolepyruvate oxidoreductase, partial [Calditrichaeota bacterium]|nr:indolepyruvate oxidoreductase [Calditrichota bacterium]
SSHVRFGPKVQSPLIPNGQADVVLAFEAAEGLRWASQVKPDGALVMNTQRIVPPIAFTKEYNYPDDPVGEAKKHAPKVIAMDAESIASQVGNVKMVNVVLLGAIADYLPLADEIWETIIRRRVPKGTDEANLAAFRKGREAVKMTY